MNLKNIRCKLGKNKQDVRRETGISKNHLEALEEGRRKLTETDIKKLGQSYNILSESLRGLEHRNEDDLNKFISAIREYGNLKNARNEDNELFEAFIYLMNDIWSMCNNSTLYTENGVKDESAIVEERVLQLKKSLLKELAREYDSERVRSFIYTYNRKKSPSLCKVEFYYPDETDDESWNIVLEDIGAVITLYEDVFAETINELIKYQKNYDNKVRIFIKDVDDGKIEYSEYSMEGKIILRNTKLPYNPDKKRVKRTYRRLMRAKEMPKPHIIKEKSDCRCKDNSKGMCPMMTDDIPNENNGCSYCRGIMETWKAREWLLKKLSDDDLKKCKNVYQLKSNHTEIYKEFEKHFNDSDTEIYKLYNYVYTFGNYQFKVSDNIVIQDGSEYENGRHRTKIAQNMDITIPVLWETFEKLNEELIEKK